MIISGSMELKIMPDGFVINVKTREIVARLGASVQLLPAEKIKLDAIEKQAIKGGFKYEQTGNQ